MPKVDYAGMTFEQFAGTPVIITGATVELDPYRLVGAPEPFMGYTARITDDLSFVLHNNVLVASFVRGKNGQCSRLAVDLRYRGQGLATRLVYQTMERTPGLTTPARERSAEGQAVYRRVWERLTQL